MSKNTDFGKIKVGKLYIKPDNCVVRVMGVNIALKNVIVYNYHSHTNEVVPIDIAADSFGQAYKLADAARVVGKKSATIRKYENTGLIPKARKITTNPEGRAQTRVYSQEDLDQLVIFFERRRPAGRPSLYRSNASNKEEVKNKLDQIKMKEKLNG